MGDVLQGSYSSMTGFGSQVGRQGEVTAGVSSSRIYTNPQTGKQEQEQGTYVVAGSAEAARQAAKEAAPAVNPATGRTEFTSTASYGWQYGSPGQAALVNAPMRDATSMYPTQPAPETITVAQAARPTLYAYPQGSPQQAVAMGQPGREITVGYKPASDYYVYQPGKQTRTDIGMARPPSEIKAAEGNPFVSQPSKPAGFTETITSGLGKGFDVLGWQFRNAPGVALFGFERAKNIGLGVAGMGATTIEDPLGTPGRLVQGTLGTPEAVWNTRGDVGAFLDLAGTAYISGKILQKTASASPIKPEISSEGVGLKLGYESIPRLGREGFKYGPKTIPLLKLGEVKTEVPATRTGTALMLKNLETKYPATELVGGKAGLEVIAGAYPSKGVKFEAKAFDEVQAKTFSVKENAAIKQLIREEAKTGNVVVGGSFSSAVEGVLKRQPKDYDITVQNPEAFAQKGLAALQAVGEGKFRLQGNIVEKYILTEAGKKQFVHGLDVHAFPEGYGAPETLGYGYGKKSPVEVGGIKLLNPGEQAARKGISALTPRETEFAPEPHRVKDIGDFVTISETLIKQGEYPFRLGGLARPYSLAKLAEYKAYLKGKGIEVGETGEVLFAKLHGKPATEPLGGYPSLYGSSRYVATASPTNYAAGYGKTSLGEKPYSYSYGGGSKAYPYPSSYSGTKPAYSPQNYATQGKPASGYAGGKLENYGGSGASSYTGKSSFGIGGYGSSGENKYGGGTGYGSGGGTVLPPYTSPPTQQKPPTIPPLMRYAEEAKGLKKKLERGFLVFGRKGGKEFAVAGTPLTRSEAISLGQTFVKSGAQRTFRIRPAGVTEAGKYNVRERLQELYRPKTIKPKTVGEEVFTQKAKYSIATVREKAELAAARLLKRR